MRNAAIIMPPLGQRCKVFKDGWGLPLRPQLWCSRFTPPYLAPPDSSHRLWRCDESGGVIFITRPIRTPKRCPVGTSRTKRQISKANPGLCPGVSACVPLAHFKKRRNAAIIMPLRSLHPPIASLDPFDPPRGMVSQPDDLQDLTISEGG